MQVQLETMEKMHYIINETILLDIMNHSELTKCLLFVTR